MVLKLSTGNLTISALQELAKQDRLIYEADPGSVARMLKAGAADYTIIAPYILIGEIQMGALPFTIAWLT